MFCTFLNSPLLFISFFTSFFFAFLCLIFPLFLCVFFYLSFLYLSFLQLICKDYWIRTRVNQKKKSRLIFFYPFKFYSLSYTLIKNYFCNYFVLDFFHVIEDGVKIFYQLRVVGQSTCQIITEHLIDNDIVLTQYDATYWIYLTSRRWRTGCLKVRIERLKKWKVRFQRYISWKHKLMVMNNSNLTL